MGAMRAYATARSSSAKTCGGGGTAPSPARRRAKDLRSKDAIAPLLGPSLSGEGREGLGSEGWQTKAVFLRRILTCLDWLPAREPLDQSTGFSPESINE